MPNLDLTAHCPMRWLITVSISSQKLFCLSNRLKAFLLSLPLWRTSGSTIWIWRKPTRNKDPTGSSSTSWPKLLGWPTCSLTVFFSWAWASCCRRPKPLTDTSLTSWSATAAASPAAGAVSSARCAPCSTWTRSLTPNVQKVEAGRKNFSQETCFILFILILFLRNQRRTFYLSLLLVSKFYFSVFKLLPRHFLYLIYWFLSILNLI